MAVKLYPIQTLLFCTFLFVEIHCKKRLRRTLFYGAIIIVLLIYQPAFLIHQFAVVAFQLFFVVPEWLRQ